MKMEAPPYFNNLQEQYRFFFRNFLWLMAPEVFEEFEALDVTAKEVIVGKSCEVFQDKEMVELIEARDEPRETLKQINEFLKRKNIGIPDKYLATANADAASVVA